MASDRSCVIANPWLGLVSRFSEGCSLSLSYFVLLASFVPQNRFLFRRKVSVEIINPASNLSVEKFFRRKVFRR